MTDACDQWYVELSLGPVLGPMSREDLEALAHSRGVLASDRIRQGNSESWQTAREIRGLFPDDRHPPDSTPASRLTADNHNRRARDREQQPEPVPHTPDKNTEPPVTRPAGQPQETESGEEPEATDLDVQCPPAVGDTAGLCQSDFALNTLEPETPTTPLSGQPETVEQEFEPSLNGGNESSGDDSSGDEKSHRTSPDPALSTGPPAWNATIDADFPVVPAVSYPPQSTGPSTPYRNSAASHPALQPRRRPLRLAACLLLILTITAAALFSAVTGLRSYRESDIYDRLSGIYEEWRRHNNSEATAPWPEFVAQSRAEIADTLPWLEENAEPGNRNHSLLLFACRDLQDVLDHPPGTAATHARRLHGFFEQLAEIYPDSK